MLTGQNLRANQDLLLGPTKRRLLSLQSLFASIWELFSIWIAPYGTRFPNNTAEIVPLAPTLATLLFSSLQTGSAADLTTIYLSRRCRQ